VVQGNFAFINYANNTFSVNSVVNNGAKGISLTKVYTGSNSVQMVLLNMTNNIQLATINE